MELTQHRTKLLEAEDFRRLGVRPNECRLTVIRRAAARSAKSLAEQQLTSPNAEVELQLTRIATSTYRLLDPRRRLDVYQRAYVGRILPNALLWAGRTAFHDAADASSPTSESTPFCPAPACDAELIEMLGASPGESLLSNQRDVWTRSLSADDLIRSGGYRRRSQWLRRRLSRPATVLALMVVMIATTFWLANWSSQRNRLTLRRVQSAIRDASGQSGGPVIPDSDATGLQHHPLNHNSLDIEPPAAATEVAEVMTEAGSPSPAAVVKISEADAIGPNDPSTSELATGDGKVLVESDVARRPDQPMEVATHLPAADVQVPASVATSGEAHSSEPLATDEPTLDALEMREWDSLVSGVKGYVLDLLKSDVWAGGPMLETRDLDVRDVVDSTPAAEMPKAEEIPATEMAAEPRQRYPLPAAEESALVRKQWAVMEPVLVRGIGPDEAVALMQRIDDGIDDLEVGTAGHFTACLIAAELAWTVQQLAEVQARLQPLTANYETNLSPLLAASFVGAIALADLPETHEHLLNVGLRLAEQLLLAESFESCDTVVSAARQSADVLDDETAKAYLDQYTESVFHMSRQATSMAGVVNAEGEILDTATSEKIGVAGRYYCLMLRRWKTSLPWLVNATDPRIAGLAEKELLLDAEATGDDLSELAELWLAAASRSSGRSSDSMRLHAIELLRRASLQSSLLKKLEMTRTIEGIEQSLPPFLLAPAATETISTGEPMSLTPKALPESRLRAEAGLVGRLRSRGRDVGVRLIYEPGVPMSDVVIEQISERLKVELDAFEIEFDGAFELAEPTTMQATFAQVAGVTQTIWIDETSLDLDDATTSLKPGRHRIRWFIETAEMSPIFLRVQDAESQREIEIAQPDSPSDDPLPTLLTVKMVRRSE